MQLVAADALLARAHQERSLKPDVQWNVAGLEHGIFANRELTATLAALLQTKPDETVFAFHSIERIAPLGPAAVRANRTVRPDDAF